MANNVTRVEFAEYMTSFEARIDKRFDSLERYMNVQFEETRSLIKLSLEGLEGLRETTERGFAEVCRENQENKTLLEAALRHVGHRVENVERRRR